MLCQNVPNRAIWPRTRHERDTNAQVGGGRLLPLLIWDTNLSAPKRCNSTHGHTGKMARWKCHGIIV
jgi:hypothetical protein